MATLSLEMADGTGTRIAALEHVDDLRVTATRNRATTITGSVFVPKERFAVAEWQEGKTRLLAYLDDTLIAHTLVGPCSDEVSGASELLKFTSADPLVSPLGRRRVQTETTYTTQDQGAIIKARIDAQNTRSTTFIGTTAYSFTTGTTRTLTAEVDKPESELIAEICSAYDGCDFAIIPTSDGTTKMGEARVWAERGSTLTNVAFESGPTGKRNVESFTLTVDPTAITTNEKVTGIDSAAWSGTNATTQTAYGTILDSLDPLSDVASSTLLQAYGEQLLEWRSQPRYVLNITPNAALGYLPVIDFDVADFIPVHLDGGRWTGDRAISGAIRCYGWELTRDSSGAARCSNITMLPEDQGGL